MHTFFPLFQNYLRSHFSSLPDSLIQSLSPQLASPFTFRLPRAQLESAQNIVRDLNQILHKAHPQKNPSILNSLDVHVDENGDLKIIEINTNASSYMVNTAHAAAKNLNTFSQAKADLKMSFEKAFGKSLKKGELFLIIDDKPEQQNMYFEFLMFRDFVKEEFSMECEIASPEELTLNNEDQVVWKNRNVFAIYNRHTDFYLTHTPVLAKAFQHEKTLISPNPWTYGLIADKSRLVEWSQTDLGLPHLQKALLKTYRFSDFKGVDDLWSQRSRFFFKPPNAFGSRSVYKGKSISRTTFNKIYNDDYLAQETAPAPEVTFEYENQKHTFKYDLRFYFFEDTVQLGAARLYQGQLTNLKTPLGGLTPLEIM